MRLNDVPVEVELDRGSDARTTIEKEEDWVYFHLSCASQARARLQRLQPGHQFDHDLHTRRLALAGAMKHVELLRRMHSPLPPLLEQMMRAEGL